MPKGFKVGGRVAGSPNKVGARAKDMLAAFLDNTASEFHDWVAKVAKTEPHKACDIYLKALEFNLPKLARTELQPLDADGNKSSFNIQISHVNPTANK